MKKTNSTSSGQAGNGLGKELLNSQSSTISFQFDNIDENTPAKVKMSVGCPFYGPELNRFEIRNPTGSGYTSTPYR